MKNITSISRTNWLKCSSIINCADELNSLVRIKDKKAKKELLLKFNDCVINAISEIALNCLNGKIPLTKRQFHLLSKSQNILRKLTSKRLNNNIKRKILIQSGGFLPYLIHPAISLISAVVSRLIREK